MALQYTGVPYLKWPMPLAQAVNITSVATAPQSILLDAALESAAIVMPAPKTGNIDRIKWRTNTWTTAGANNIEIAVETVANNGMPNFTKTLWGTNTEGTKTPVATDDNVWIETTLTAAAAVVQGDVFAVCIRNPSANASVFNIAALQTSNVNPPPASNVLPKMAQALGAPPTAFASGNGAWPMIAIRYDDGTWWFADGMITGTGATTVYNSGTNPRYRGNRFQVPFKCRAIGLTTIISNPAASGTFIARIRDDSGTALASSPAFDSDWFGGATVDSSVELLFDASVTLDPGTWYRMTIEPQTATNITLLRLDVSDTDIMTCSPGGTNFYLTTSNNLSTWTDTTDEKSIISLLIDALDDGTGGGGGGLALPPVRVAA